MAKIKGGQGIFPPADIKKPAPSPTHPINSAPSAPPINSAGNNLLLCLQFSSQMQEFEDFIANNVIPDHVWKVAERHMVLLNLMFDMAIGGESEFSFQRAFELGLLSPHTMNLFDECDKFRWSSDILKIAKEIVPEGGPLDDEWSDIMDKLATRILDETGTEMDNDEIDKLIEFVTNHVA